MVEEPFFLLLSPSPCSQCDRMVLLCFPSDRCASVSVGPLGAKRCCMLLVTSSPGMGDDERGPAGCLFPICMLYPVSTSPSLPPPLRVHHLLGCVLLTLHASLHCYTLARHPPIRTLFLVFLLHSPSSRSSFIAVCSCFVPCVQWRHGCH